MVVRIKVYSWLSNYLLLCDFQGKPELNLYFTFSLNLIWVTSLPNFSILAIKAFFLKISPSPCTPSVLLLPIILVSSTMWSYKDSLNKWVSSRIGRGSYCDSDNNYSQNCTQFTFSPTQFSKHYLQLQKHYVIWNMSI